MKSPHLAGGSIARALARAEKGRGISREEAVLLMEKADLPSLLHAASSLRDRVKGRLISFSKKVFIPLTTLCRDRCGYCTFRKDPGDEGGRYMTPEDVLRAAETARKAGCKEALFSLGDQPERAFRPARAFLQEQGFQRTLEYLAAMTKLTLERSGLLPHSNPGLMSQDDLTTLKATNVSAGLMLENSSPRLMRRGSPHGQAPDKAPALRLRTIEDAGRLRIPFTTGILIGIGENLEERIDSLMAIRALHEKYGHIQEVIIQNFRAKPGTAMAENPEPAVDDVLRTVAIGRLILGGEMNLQVPPNLSALNYPRLLEAGINDWGGISPVTPDFINPEAAWPQIAALRHRTEQAGFVLRERLAIYPEFISRPGFVHEGIRAHLMRLVDREGYARQEPGLPG